MCRVLWGHSEDKSMCQKSFCVHQRVHSLLLVLWYRVSMNCLIRNILMNLFSFWIMYWTEALTVWGFWLWKLTPTSTNFNFLISYLYDNGYLTGLSWIHISHTHTHTHTFCSAHYTKCLKHCVLKAFSIMASTEWALKFTVLFMDILNSDGEGHGNPLQ